MKMHVVTVDESHFVVDACPADIACGTVLFRGHQLEMTGDGWVQLKPECYVRGEMVVWAEEWDDD